jgi:hypothetical protein
VFGSNHGVDSVNATSSDTFLFVDGITRDDLRIEGLGNIGAGPDFQFNTADDVFLGGFATFTGEGQINVSNAPVLRSAIENGFGLDLLVNISFDDSIL